MAEPDASADVMRLLRDGQEWVTRAQIVQALSSLYNEETVTRAIDHWIEQTEIIEDADGKLAGGRR